MITTALILFGIFAAFMWPTVSSLFAAHSSVPAIVIVDQTGGQAENYFHSSKEMSFKFLGTDRIKADRLVTSNKANGVLVLGKNSSGQLTAKIRTAGTALKLNDQQFLDQQVQTANKLFTIKQMSLTAGQAQQILNTHVTLEQQTMNHQMSGKSADSKMKATIISYGVAFFVYLFVLSYLSIISSEIAAEKDSRIMEIIISSATPVTHLLSRVTAVLALGLTQIGVILGTALIMAFSFDKGKYGTLIKETLSAVSVSYLIYVILFFVSACIFYILVGAVLGSLVNKVQDVGQAVMPVTFVLMIGFFIAISGLNNPDTLLIRISSYIPFVSSMIMPMRIGATDLAFWEAPLSLIILAASVVGLFLFSLRFYKGSVLTYSSGSFIRKIKQAMALSR